MSAPPSVNVARLTYLLACLAAGYAVVLGTAGTEAEIPLWAGVVGGLALAGFFIFIETLLKGFTLRGFSTATFGLGVGLFCAWLITRLELATLFELAFSDPLAAGQVDAAVLRSLRIALEFSIYASLGFLGAVLALRSNRDDFAFIIPYVRFRQDAASGQPIVLDPEAVIDGRVPGILRAGFLHGRLIVPRFVLEELQVMANSPSNATRQRGQRGLDCLERMQKAAEIQVSIHDARGLAEEETLAMRLLETARLLGARLMSVDDNLTKIAKLQGVDVLSIHELDEALRPAVAVGERVRIALVRGGKEEHQAVGYLPDGTMIVVNHAAAKIGSTVDVMVISTLQTSGGTMVFAELHQAG